MGALIVLVVLVVLLIVLPGIRIINQYERGVVLRLGKYSRTLEPGFRVIIPYIDKMTKVDVRTTPMDVPKQEVITRDNVTVNVDAVVYSRVIDARKAVLETTNYRYATATFAQTALRDVTGNLIWTNCCPSGTRFLRRLRRLWTRRRISGGLILRM